MNSSQNNDGERAVWQWKARYEEESKALKLARQELEEKNKELEALKSSLSAHSESSDQEIISMATKINDLVEQLAETGAMVWSVNPAGPADVDVKAQVDIAFLEEVISPSLVDALQSCRSDDIRTVLIQIAWKAYIVDIICRALTHFSFAAQAAPQCKYRDASNLIEGLSKAIQKAEEQTVFSHWRAMTHRHLRTVVERSAQEKRRKRYAQDMFRGCNFIMTLAVNGDCLTAQEAKFEERATEIMDLVEQLGIMIREEVATKNFEPLAPRPSERFEPTSMDISIEIGNDANSTAAGGRVACATSFGLVYTKGASSVQKAAALKARVTTQYAIELLLKKAARRGTAGSGQARLTSVKR